MGKKKHKNAPVRTKLEIEADVITTVDLMNQGFTIKEVARKINEERVNNGKDPLSWNAYYKAYTSRVKQLSGEALELLEANLFADIQQLDKNQEYLMEAYHKSIDEVAKLYKDTSVEKRESDSDGSNGKITKVRTTSTKMYNIAALTEYRKTSEAKNLLLAKLIAIREAMKQVGEGKNEAYVLNEVKTYELSPGKEEAAIVKLLEEYNNDIKPQTDESN